MGEAIYGRESAFLDGRILNIASGDLGNANTSYTYIDIARQGMKYFTVEHIITATTLTIEACNVGLPRNEVYGTTRDSICTATSGGGTLITDSTLATPFPTDTDLIGIQVRVLADNTAPSNIGVTRTVTAHTGATGALTLSSALPGASTSGVTRYRLEDSPTVGGRLLSDPTGAQWRDVTDILTGAATHTASGVWVIDTAVLLERIRVKRLTTNAVNALVLRLTRGR